MDEENLTLFDAKNLGKKILDSWAYILLCLIFFLAVLSGYTSVNLDLLGAVNIGIDYAILLLFCYGAMYSLDAIAKKRGSEDPRYTKAAERVDTLRARLKEVDGEKLQEFCEAYRDSELRCTRRQILTEAMLTEKDFEDFLRGGKFNEGMPFVQKMALRRARSCKPIKLNRYMIGRPLSATYKRLSLYTPEQRMKKGNMARVLSTAITIIFPVSLTMSVIMEPTIATFVSGLLKVFTVALAGCKSYHGRFKNMTEDVPAYAEIQEEIVDKFESWLCKDTKKEEQCAVSDPLPITPP